MFEPINAPPSHYDGPATGLSQEKGDSWKTAVDKINAGFARVIGAIEGAFTAPPLAAPLDNEGAKLVDELRETVSAAQQKIDHLEAELKTLGNMIVRFVSVGVPHTAAPAKVDEAPQS